MVWGKQGVKVASHPLTHSEVSIDFRTFVAADFSDNKKKTPSDFSFSLTNSVIIPGKKSNYTGDSLTFEKENGSCPGAKGSRQVMNEVAAVDPTTISGFLAG